MEVNLCNRILKIKSHTILCTEYLCIEITCPDFLPLNITLYISQQIIFTFIFFNVKKLKIKYSTFKIKINLNNFNVPKFNKPKSLSKLNV